MKKTKRANRFAVRDAYGAELLATYAGENEHEIVERDDGYIEAAHTAKTYFSEYSS